MENAIKICYVALVTVMISGCTTHRMLGRNTIHQTKTLSNLIEQQVLDNVATFGVNPGALPHFAVIADGTSQTQDGGLITPSMTWNFTMFTGASLPIQASRQVMGNWKLQPVMSAARLKRMRCALQLLYSPPTIELRENCVSVSSGCINCINELITVGLLPKPESFEDLDCGCSKCEGWCFANSSDAECYVQKLQEAIHCRIPTGWFCLGSKKEALRSCRPVGSFCDSYAWVKPGCDDEFSRFTMTLLALATTDPKPGPSKQEIEISFSHLLKDLQETTQGLTDVSDNKGESLSKLQKLLSEIPEKNAEVGAFAAKFDDLRKAILAQEKREKDLRLELENLQRSATNRINEIQTRLSGQEDDIFNRSGSMPFSRGGGIEFTP